MILIMLFGYWKAICLTNSTSEQFPSLTTKPFSALSVLVVNPSNRLDALQNRGMGVIQEYIKRMRCQI